MTRGRAVLRSTLGNYLAKFASLGIWFLITPFLVHRLGSDAFGAWALLTSLATFSAQFDYAIGAAIVREVAATRARANLAEGAAVVATAWAICLAYAALLAPAALVAAPIVAPWIAAGSVTRAAAAHLVLLTAANAIVSLGFVASSSVLRGLQRFDLANVSTLLAGALTGLAAVGTLATGGGVRAMVAGTTGALALVVAVNHWLLRRADPTWRIRWGDARRRLVAPILGFSSPLLVTSLAARVQTKTGEILVAALMPVTAVTAFHLSRRLSEIPAILTDQFLRVVLPLASELDAAGHRGRLRELYVAGTRITLVILLSTGGLLACLAGPLLSVWIGESFASSAPLVVVLLATALLQTSQAIAAVVLQAMKRHRPLAAVALISGAASVALSALLVPRFGLLGVSIALLVPTAVAATGIAVYTARTLEIRPLEVLTRAVIPAAVPLAPMLAVLWLLQSWIGDRSWTQLAGLGGAGLLTYGAFYLRFGAGELERRTFRSALGRLGIDRDIRGG